MKLAELLTLTKEDLNGKIIAFPTDTVYGVAALFNDVDGCNKIYELKNRDFNKPLPILASNVDEIYPLIELPSTDVCTIMEKYWPGALTIIFNKNKSFNYLVNSNFQTIGFRIPKSRVALEILKRFGPMATTSVNISGEAPINSYQDIKMHFGDKIDYIIEDEALISKVSSTVIDVTKVPYKVLRMGDIKL